MEVLRISPNYTSENWQALDSNNPEHWQLAADIVRDRLEGRFLRFSTECLVHKDFGFVVLSIDCLLAEAIQQFKNGVINGSGHSKKMVTLFLEGSRFQPDFDKNAREAFYTDVRCGLLHQAEAKEMWLIRRNQPAMLQTIMEGQGYIIDVKRFHAAVQDSLNDYLDLIPLQSNSLLRSNLWNKMNQICNVRMARGALYGTEE